MFVPEDGEVKREKTEMAKDEEVRRIGNQDDEIVKLVTTSWAVTKEPVSEENNTEGIKSIIKQKRRMEHEAPISTEEKHFMTFEQLS